MLKFDIVILDKFRSMKTIKSIRILDTKNITNRSESVDQSPEIFSFSKKDTGKYFRNITEDDIREQKIEMGKLDKMIRGMLKKCQHQQEEIETLS